MASEIRSKAVEAHEPERILEDSSAAAIRLLDEVIEQARYQRELGEFFASVHEKALARAKKYLPEADAEDAVAETYLKLLRGKTQQKHFFRALKQSCLDRIRQKRREESFFEPMPESVSPKLLALSEVAWGPEGINTVPIEPSCTDSEDGDFLARLIREEEVLEGMREVMSSRKRHSVRQRKWWKDLIEMRPEALELLRK